MHDSSYRTDEDMPSYRGTMYWMDEACLLDSTYRTNMDKLSLHDFE